MTNFFNEFVTDLSMFWLLAGLVILVLVLFGIIYNHLVTMLGEQREPYLPFLVSGGVLATLLAMAVFSWKAAFIGLLAFAASGLPMIIGSVLRSVNQERANKKLISDEHLRMIDQTLRDEIKN